MNKLNINEIFESYEKIHIKYHLKPYYILLSPEMYKLIFSEEGEWFYYESSNKVNRIEN